MTTKKIMSKPIKVVDLFAGPGGLGEGFSSVGPDASPTFKIVASVEKEASAHKTLTLRAFTREFPNRTLPKEYYQYLRREIEKQALINAYPREWAAAQKETFGAPLALGDDNEVIHAGIEKSLRNSKDPWVLIGGPPCQAYSLAGRARNKSNTDYSAESDHRHFLYKEYLAIIAKYEPSVFVMENVKGILSSTPLGTPIFEKILGDLKSPTTEGCQYNIYSLSTPPASVDDNAPRYNARDFTIKSEQYGIPQCRHRVILIGIRTDIKIDVSALLLKRRPKVSVESMLKSMPSLRSGITKETDSSDNWQNIIQPALAFATKHITGKSSSAPALHLPVSRGAAFIQQETTCSTAIPNDLLAWIKDDKLKGLIQHETRGHMRSDLQRYSYVSMCGKLNGKSPVISELPPHLLPNHKNVNSGNFVDRFKVQLANHPSKTITSHIAKDSHAFIHYDPLQSRGLTVREAARLQTFPDNYLFEGNRTQQYTQVGNAVPPYLANQIGCIVAGVLSTPHIQKVV